MKPKRSSNRYESLVNHTLALILGGGKGTRLSPLTLGRSKPAVPFAGNYRIIDIPISNCINSGLNRVFVLTQFNSASLNRHIIQTYKFDLFHNGFVDILASEQTVDSLDGGFSEGTADAVRKSLKHLRDFRDIRYVLVLAGDQLYRMNFRDLITAHHESGSRITMGVLPVCDTDISRFGILQLDNSRRVTGFTEKPRSRDGLSGWEIPSSLKPRSCQTKDFFGSMGIYLFDADTLFKALTENPQMLDFGREVIPYCIDKYPVSAYIHDDYWEDIGTIASYHNANIDLTAPQPVFNLYEPSFPFFSKPRFLPPTKIISSDINNSILSEGCVLDDVRVNRSIIGIRSIIKRKAMIERSVVIGADFFETGTDKNNNRKLGLPDIGVGPGSIIENAIIDKNCRIGRGCRISNDLKVIRKEHPLYRIVDGIVVIPKNTVIPDHFDTNS